jgi:peptidyl-prolyl cis-trans isomerase D
MLEKATADNSQLASISYVNAPYFMVPDSAVKISDAEIQDYINKYPDRFKQDESRSLAYVSFNAGPNGADTARVKQQVADMIKDLEKTNDIQAFLGRMGSTQPFFDGYLGKSLIKVPYKDSIFALQKGQVFGPYLDAGSFVIAKLIDEKVLPDSVSTRHILIKTTDPRSGQVIHEDSVAKKMIDSIKNVLDHGGNWDSVALKASEDDGSKGNGGKYLNKTSTDGFAQEYADFMFNGKKGDKKVIKTVFGWHYVEILEQKNFEPSYKIAYVSRKIDASQETDQAAFGLASQFAAQSRDAKAFDENVQKDHLQKLTAPDFGPAESNIPGLGFDRSLVQWAFKAEVGNVSEPSTVGDKYVVAILTEINKEGIMSPAKARNQVEPILRNKKKAEELVKKLGSPASLDAAATAAGTPVQNADSLQFSTSTIAGAGQEPKVVGAAFDKQLSGKPVSPAISGNGGVYFIKVNNVSAVSNPNMDIQQQRFMQEQQMRQIVNYRLVESMRKLATIKDNRADFF